ncbi:MULTISPECIES: ATP-binding cassette domain-containing protein [Bacteroides]|jgi:ABC-2 type transport system ATP-binding protein|uniref:ABC transporter ATP-binding protein n=1 Tax=Bacteroides TaxID=816 RepID=UPI000E50702F|nr:MULTISPECIES: ABC transporter ATP-binding protein [Bacteroides]RHL05920.1 ABC transporter ATP-binding protein [Bacteroides sp. AF39-11AC]
MIKIENVNYGYKSKQPIFNDISLEVGSGIYGLLGENGVGKTTLMHLICGLLFPWKGECKIDNCNSAQRSPELLSHYFFLPEEMQMPTESIYQFAAHHSVFYPHFSRKEFEQNLEELHIDGKQKLSTVSYGQQKKAMLAYALALHTPLTLLDEPTNGLDITSRQTLKRIISRSVDDESTLLISTHQAHDFENLLDHLIILGEGEILLNHSLDEISERLLFVRTASLPEDSLYSEQDLHGYFSILSNEEGEENTTDIELLYKAMLQEPERIKMIWNE